MGILIWYTVETLRLRKAAQRQNEISIMPVLVLEFESGERALAGHMKLEDPQLRNIGNGPAFNIQVATIAGPDLEVRFDGVPVLDKAAGERLRFTIWQGGKTTGFSRRTVLLASVITSGQLGAKTAVAATFNDSAGVRYRSGYVIRYDSTAKETTTAFVGQHKVA
jgi:hypothetical protein